MNTQEQKVLLKKAKDFFRSEIVESHIEKACKRAGKLSNRYGVSSPPLCGEFINLFLSDTPLLCGGVVHL
jgi:hypothetical protein